MSDRKRWLHESHLCGGRDPTSDHPYIRSRCRRTTGNKWRQPKARLWSPFPWLRLVLWSKKYFFVCLWVLTINSFSTPITVEGLVLPIKLAGKLHKPFFFLSNKYYFIRSGLVAYHILQSGVNCRLPKTPRSESIECLMSCCFNFVFLAPRTLAHHYFDVRDLLTFWYSLTYSADFATQETIDSRSEFGDDAKSAFSTTSAWDPLHTLNDLSPDAL